MIITFDPLMKRDARFAWALCLPAGIGAVAPRFVAAGPRTKRGVVVAPFENVHIYNILCAVLRVDPARNDGDAAIIRRLLED